MQFNGLIQAFDYIENVRSYGYNKGGKRRIKKEKLTDLYFAGKYIILLINENGTDEEKKNIKNIINKYKKSFKTI